MTFSERIQDLVNKGIEGSREFLAKAGEQAQTWGEMGVVKVEILQYRREAERLTTSLGAAVYAALAERGQNELSAEDPAVKSLLAKLKELEKLIDEKEARFRALGGKDADLDREDRPGA